MTTEQEARVILVDLAVTGFSDFAHKHAVDLLGETPEVWLWSIGKPDGVGLPGWPKYFKDMETLGDALADAMESRSTTPTAIIFLASSAANASSRLFPSQQQSPLGPLQGVIDLMRMGTRVWKILASVGGPQAQDPEAADMIGLVGGVQQINTVVYLGEQQQLAKRIDSVWNGLRLLIDVARNIAADGADDMWTALRPVAQGSQPRALWFKAKGNQFDGRARKLRNVMSLHIDKLNRDAVDAAASRNAARSGFASHVEGQLKKNQPQTETGSGLVAKVAIDENLLFPEKKLQEEAVGSLKDGVIQLGETLQKHYADQLAGLATFQRQEDQNYATNRNEIERLSLALPNLGWISGDVEYVNEQIKEIAKKQQQWRHDAAEKRGKMLAEHQSAQQRNDPVAPGALVLQGLKNWESLESSVTGAQTTATWLKHGKFDWLWVVLTGGSVAAYVLAIWWLSLTRQPWVTPFFFLAAVPVAGVLYYLINSHFIWRHRQSLTLVRDAAKACAADVDAMLAAAQSFVNASRADLLAESLIDRIKAQNRVAEATEIAGFLKRLKVGETTGNEQDIPSAWTAPNLSVHELVASWRGKNEAGNTLVSLKLKKINAVAGVQIDTGAERRDRDLSFSSTAMFNDVQVEAEPLRIASESEVNTKPAKARKKAEP